MIRFEYENICITLEFRSSVGSIPAYSAIYVRIDNKTLYQRLYSSYVDARKECRKLVDDVFFLQSLPDLVTHYGFSLIEDLPF